MFNIIFSIIFVVSLIGLYIAIIQKFALRYKLTHGELMMLEEENRGFLAKEQRIKEENSKKEESVTKTMNLYEITKEIGEYLEEEKIFNSFKKGLNKFLKFQECNYLNSVDEQGDLSNFEVIPLVSKSKEYGYLAIKGLSEVERPILDILVSQLLVGLKRARLYELVQNLAITDSLTKAFTRRHFFNRYNEELQRSQDLNLYLSFLMIDIDNFKYFNDTYGHLVGDVILKTIADIIRLNCREIDLIGRFGGEEFTVVLPMTTKDGALFAAERIRKSIESTSIKAFDESLSVTVSIGVASFPKDAKTDQELIDKADWALYRSKRTGKNKVSAYARYK